MQTSRAGGMVWTGRAVTALVAFPFIPGALMAFLRKPEVIQGMAHMGLPESLILPLGILELICVTAYLIPRTAILGAILLTGYMGGAILTHLRLGEPVYLQTALGVLAWLGIYLREPRLRRILPWRNDIGQ